LPAMGAVWCKEWGQVPEVILRAKLRYFNHCLAHDLPIPEPLVQGGH
jgi:hypothetical protein